MLFRSLLGGQYNSAELKFQNWEELQNVELDGGNGDAIVLLGSSWNLSRKNCQYKGLKFISREGIQILGMENCKFYDCEFINRNGEVNIEDCVDLEIIGCKWSVESIANYGMKISNAKLRFQSSAIKFQSQATGTIIGIDITSSIVRFTELELSISSAQIESNIIGIQFDNPDKIWLTAVDYQLDAPETENSKKAK